MKYVLRKLFLSINCWFFCAVRFHIFKKIIYFSKFFFICLPPVSCTQLFHRFHLHLFLLEGAKTKKNLFNVCRLRSRFLLILFSLLFSVLFIGNHSFIIYHGNWDENNFMLGPVKRGKILANLINDKSVISLSTLNVPSTSSFFPFISILTVQTYIKSPTQVPLSKRQRHEGIIYEESSRREILPKVIKLSLSWTFFCGGFTLSSTFLSI